MKGRFLAKGEENHLLELGKGVRVFGSNPFKDGVGCAQRDVSLLA